MTAARFRGPLLAPERHGTGAGGHPCYLPKEVILHDVTCCARELHAESWHARGIAHREPPALPASAGSPDPRHGVRTDDEDVLAAVLIRMWSLASGRILRSDVRPEQLTEDELIRFWADDMDLACGRHAARRGAQRREAR